MLNVENESTEERSQNTNFANKVQEYNNEGIVEEITNKNDESILLNFNENNSVNISHDSSEFYYDNNTINSYSCRNEAKKVIESDFQIDEEVDMMMNEILNDAAKMAAEMIANEENKNKLDGNIDDAENRNINENETGQDNLSNFTNEPKENISSVNDDNNCKNINLNNYSLNGDIYSTIDYTKKKNVLEEFGCLENESLGQQERHIKFNEISGDLDILNGNESINNDNKQINVENDNENIINIDYNNEEMKQVSNNIESIIENCELNEEIISTADDVTYATIDDISNIYVAGNVETIHQYNPDEENNTPETSTRFYDNASNIMNEFMRTSNEEQIVEHDTPQHRPSRPTSVVASTHYITSEYNSDILTESERLLGKIEPVWIDDKEADNCMLCNTKFSLLLRRHHCRSCGRVLCNSCCNQRKSLKFANDDSKKFRVCESCVKTLTRVEEVEKREREHISISVLQEDPELQAAAMNEVIINRNDDQSVPGPSGVLRQKKSVLKVKNTEEKPSNGETEQSTSSGSRRSVTFLDGVAPGEGEDNDEPQVFNTILSQRRALKKIKGKGGPALRKMRETRIAEESKSLLRTDYCVVADDEYVLHKKTYEEMNVKFREFERITIALQRNIHVIVQYKKLPEFNCSHAISLFTKGLSSMGVEEILFIWEINGDKIDSLEIPYEMLAVVNDIVSEGIAISSDSTDVKYGVNVVYKRLKQLYKLKNEFAQILGFHAVLLHPVRSHDFHNLELPMAPFFIGTFIYTNEYKWARTIPNRLLYYLGLNTGCYPTPIVNFKNRTFSFTEKFQTTILKVAIDFKSQKYGISQIYGSYVTLTNNKVSLWLPKYAKEDVRKIVLENKSMIIMGLDFNYHADSHLVCEQQESGYFSTTIFTRPNQTREKTGATFIIFDGALKNTTNKISRSIVEDGAVVRLNMDYMNELATALENGREYELTDSAFNLSIHWFDISVKNEYSPHKFADSRISPIDSLFIGDRYQYGLNYIRIYESQNMIPSATEWSIRLASVIHIDEGKIRSIAPSRIFEIGEMIAARIALTIAPFIQILIFNNISRITFRLNIESENNVKYTTESWPSLEDEYAVWNFTIEDQIVPFLYQLVNHTPNGLNIELNMPIISTRPLPCFDEEEKSS
uniref:FYVE-type domain-containing protein n=1 Tax=Parastrongyloides trichosuri TaxID=131310 RepID=A0A0N5A3M7_PARTI